MMQQNPTMKRVLSAAEELAKKQGYDRVFDEYLLGGILLQGAQYSRLLRDFGLNLKIVRDYRGDKNPGLEFKGYSHSSGGLLDASNEIAGREGSQEIRVIHLLKAILDEHNPSHSHQILKGVIPDFSMLERELQKLERSV